MIPQTTPLAAALFRQKARSLRLTAFRMRPSLARSAVERIALRWEILSAAGPHDPAPANDP